MLRGFNEYFERFARQRAAKGLLAECGSPTYGKYSVNTWYNFAGLDDGVVVIKKGEEELVLDFNTAQ